MPIHHPILPSVLLIAALASSPIPARAADSPIYTQIVKNYLDGKWETLETDLTQHAKDIAALPKDQAADILYIRQTFAECRPAWWNQIKQGKKIQIRPTIWSRTINVTWDPAISSNIQLKQAGSNLNVAVLWPAADMDSNEHAEHGFTKGDLTDLGVWTILGSAGIWWGSSLEKISKLPEEEKIQFQRYSDFRAHLTGVYYSTPRSRRWGAFLSLDAFGDKYVNNAAFIPRKPFGSFLMAEIAGHPARYPSLKIPSDLPADSTEKKLAAALMPQFERNTLTLAEDRALRDAIKEFAPTNAIALYAKGIVTLPNGLTVMIDPSRDAELAGKRDAWLLKPITPPATTRKAP